MLVGVLLFGFLYCLPLLISLVVGWILLSDYWREYGELSVGSVIFVALMFLGAWIPLVNILVTVVLLHESNDRYNWGSRTLIKSRARQHEEMAARLRGDY